MRIIRINTISILNFIGYYTHSGNDLLVIAIVVKREAEEYERAREVLADIEADPCREITRESTRNSYYIIHDYYSQICEKQGDYENAVDEIITAGGYLNIKKFSKDTLYYDRLHDLRKKVSKDTQKKIDEICE